jgi:signal peptidase I
MERFQKIEIALLCVILIINLILFIFVFSSNKITGFAVFGIDEKKTPHDFISEDQIIANQSGVFIEIKNPILSRYNNSESMLPVLFQGTNGIGFKPISEEEVHVGDIITFKQNAEFIVHRVIEKGTDKQGVYFITQGDNNDAADEKIRFSQIDSVLVGLIY